MPAVVRRQLDAGQRGGIEARLVEHHDDVRRLAGQMAGLVRRGAKLIRGGGIEIDPALGRQLIARRHAGAHEGRDVIDALELLPGLLRHRERQAGDGGRARRPRRAAPADRRTRNGSIRQISTSTGTTISDADDEPSMRRSGKIESRKATVSESTISTSKKLITIQRIENLNCDSTTTAANRPSDSAAEIAGRRSSARNAKLSSAQASRNSAGPTQPYSVHASDAERGEMERGDATPTPSQRVPARRCLSR